MLAIAVIAVSGLFVGWRIQTGPLDAISGFALLILISFTMLWVGTLLGVSARSPDAVQGVVFVLAFPLTFIATAHVPIAGLPGALRTLAEYNPVSAFAAAVRHCSATRRPCLPTSPGRTTQCRSQSHGARRCSRSRSRQRSGAYRRRTRT